MTIVQIKQALNDRKLSVVASALGINKHTLYNFMNGKSTPNALTIKALQQYLGDK